MIPLLLLASCIVQEDPVRVTRERMTRLAGAVSVYHGLSGQWPPTLSTAAALAGMDLPKDGWGRTFGYEREAVLTESQRELLKRALKDLAAEDVDVRQRAEREIESLGFPANQQLKMEIALASDAEVKARLEGIRNRVLDPRRPPRLWSFGADGKEMTIVLSAVHAGAFFEESEKGLALRVAAVAAAAEATRGPTEALPGKIEDVVKAGWLSAEDAREVRIDRLDGCWRVGTAPKEGAPVCLYRFDASTQKIEENELNASVFLKPVATAEADFRANDRDGNGTPDFWVADLSGLFRHEWRGPGGNRIMLIEESLAKADAARLPAGGKLGELLCPLPEPVHGYLFRVVERHSSGPYAEDTDKSGLKWRNKNRFAVCAYPAVYGVTGRQTFFIDEENTVLKKDIKGRPLKVFLNREGWSRLD